MATTTEVSDTRGPGSVVLRFLKRFWLPLILTVVAVVFIVQNTQRVSVNFLVFQMSSWLWLILTLFALGGLVAGWAIGRARANRVPK